MALSTFTAPKNATAEELNQKVTQIVTAANMEAIVKDKALAAGLKVYAVSFKVVGDGSKKSVSYVIRYSETRDAEDIVQLHTMTAPFLQSTTRISKEADKDLCAIRDEYKSKLNFTFTGKKDDAFNAMKKYLESDETKDFREALQKHIATYNDADKWYISFRMKSANGLLSDYVYFGEWRSSLAK